MYESVDPENLATRLQYDYFTVYLGFYYADPDAPQRRAAAHLTEQYADYDVDRWRELFAVAGDQLAQAAGAAPAAVDPNDRGQSQTRLAASEPMVALAGADGALELRYRNVESATVNFYRMDIELLFSRSPFVREVGERFGTVQPHRSMDLTLDRAGARAIEPPQDLANENLLVEVVAGGARDARPLFANALDVHLAENYGQLTVARADTGEAIPAVYVKVYAEMNDGSVAFFKDGYTDIRGRFDYASLSTNQIEQARRLAILVLSDEHGAVIREAQPPQR
jgi:hypothetical protein